MKRILVALLPALVVCGCTPAPQYDVVIRHGTVYDGTGAAGVVQDLAIRADRIAARVGLSAARGRQEIDASGLAVAPGFIDMLNHSETALIADGRSQGMIRQGVTLVVFGENSMGPMNEDIPDRASGRFQVRHHVEHAWAVSRYAGSSRRLQ